MSEVLSSLALGACGREIVAGVELVSEQGTRLSLGGPGMFVHAVRAVCLRGDCCHLLGTEGFSFLSRRGLGTGSASHLVSDFFRLVP